MSLTIEAAIALRDTLSEDTGYRFDPHAGLVILRQTFVRRRHRWQFDALPDHRHGGGRAAEWFKAEAFDPRPMVSFSGSPAAIFGKSPARPLA